MTRARLGRSIQRTAGAILLVAVALLAVASPDRASAQGQVLVSNWQWEPSSELGSFRDFDHAQEFTTGSHGLGYTLTSVELHLRTHSSQLASLRNRLNVDIYTSSGGLPSVSRLARLTKPGTLVDVSTVHHAVLLKVDEGRDLALLETTDFEADRALQLAPSDGMNPNSQVVCFEYGTTLVSGTSITLNPATRLGNVTRNLDLTELYGPAGTRMLELSFPALKGASGAPVLSNRAFELLGVIKANVGYELLPAQIETVRDQSGKMLEETKFFLPQALAVNVAVVEDFLLSD